MGLYAGPAWWDWWGYANHIGLPILRCQRPPPTRNESNDFSTGCTKQDSSKTLTSNARWRLRTIIYSGLPFEMTDM